MNYLRIFLLAVLLAMLVVFAGCADARGDARRQETAASGATIYEAALAIEQGADPAAPLSAIKRNALAIVKAQGYQYPPAPAATH
jgi:phage tail sheath gpL-like